MSSNVHARLVIGVAVRPSLTGMVRYNHARLCVGWQLNSLPCGPVSPLSLYSLIHPPEQCSTRRHGDRQGVLCMSTIL